MKRWFLLYSLLGLFSLVWAVIEILSGITANQTLCKIVSFGGLANVPANCVKDFLK
jgi:hypothetical protein